MGERWRADLALWGIPGEIAARAPADPWGHFHCYALPLELP
ncbi:hypothetical protein FHR32_002370 [Streptosporangium album]|uniref:Uncharacterized protein n=1 Tax=Streptosporangium album TaxID=47479 RepID=A0A7W7RTV8_9ACTN|nr:hypothetical protein [Streptosporangium album]